MQTNAERMVSITRRYAARPGCPYDPGVSVQTPHGRGVVDTVYFDLQSAIDSFVVPPNFFAMQRTPPKSSPTDSYWYGVILNQGAVLVGHDDIEEGR